MAFRGNDDPGPGSALDALDHRPEAPDGRQRPRLHRCTCSCTCTATSRPSPARTPTTTTPSTCARSVSRCSPRSGFLWILRVVLIVALGRARVRRRGAVAPGRQGAHAALPGEAQPRLGDLLAHDALGRGGAAALPRLAPAGVHDRQGQRRPAAATNDPYNLLVDSLPRLVARRSSTCVAMVALGAAPAPRHLERRADPRLDQHRRGPPHAPRPPAAVLAVVIAVGFSLVPLAVLFGIIRSKAPTHGLP